MTETVLFTRYSILRNVDPTLNPLSFLASLLTREWSKAQREKERETGRETEIDKDRQTETERQGRIMGFGKVLRHIHQSCLYFIRLYTSTM